jgi:hypothetical protein
MLATGDEGYIFSSECETTTEISTNASGSKYNNTHNYLLSRNIGLYQGYTGSWRKCPNWLKIE